METSSSDSVEESNEIELLRKCKKLEDVEDSFYVQNVSKPTYRYTKDQLLKLKNHPLSTKTPVLCDNLKSLFAANNSTKPKERDDPDTKKIPTKKHGISRSFDQQSEKPDSKRTEIPRGSDKLGASFRADKSDDLRKTTDPASRLRKEQDICLSPQRKSFNTGCSVQNAAKDADSNNDENNVNQSTNSAKPNTQREITGNGNGGGARENRNDTKENRNREMPPRRIGSGRIISSDPAFVIRGYPPENRPMPKEKTQVMYKYPSPKSVDKDKDGIWDRMRSTTYYDRRKHQYADQQQQQQHPHPHSHHLDEEDSNNSNNNSKDRFWDQQRSSGGSFFDRRRYQGSSGHHQYHQHHDDEEKEPEWMKDGPDSKNDFIELRGFDENEVKHFRKGASNVRVFHKTGSNLFKSSTVNGKEPTNKRNSESDNSSVASDSITSKNDENVTAERKREAEKVVKEKCNVVGAENHPKPPEAPSIEINLDEIFKTPLTDMMGENKVVENAGSRFTRWFKRDDTHMSSSDNDPTNQAVSAGLTTAFNSLMNTVSENRNAGPVNGNSAAQESTAAYIASESSSQRLGNNSIPASNLLDLLRVSQENTSTSVPVTKLDVRTLEATGKLHSLEEIEAKLRGVQGNNQVSSNTTTTTTTSTNDRKKKVEEAEAFKQLLFQALQCSQYSNNFNNSFENFPNVGDVHAQRMKNETAKMFQGKPDFSSILCNGDAALSSFSNRVTPPQQSRMQHTNTGGHQQQQQQQQKQQQQSADMLKLFQHQQQSKSQEVFSKMLMSSGGGNYNSPVSTGSFNRGSSGGGGPNQSAAVHGPYSHLSQEIQMLVNNCQLNQELMHRLETVNILKAIRNGDLTTHHLIEQLKKTTPYQTKFRESALCVLKILQTHSPPFFASPMPMRTYNMPPFMESVSAVPTRASASPFAHSSPQSFGENVIQKMMMGQQYRNAAIPDIVYQRDFSASSHNQNATAAAAYQSNASGTISKHVPLQPQASTRMNSSLMTNTCPNNSSTNVNVNACRDDKSGAVGPAVSPHAIAAPASTVTSGVMPKSLSFTPTSVLMKLSAEKENLDSALSKDSKDFKAGEKNSLIPYSCSSAIGGVNVNTNTAESATAIVAISASQCGTGNNDNTYTRANCVDYFNNLGTYIPPPTICSQYFVGNVVRPSHLSAQTSVFGSFSTPVLSRLSLSSSSKDSVTRSPNFTNQNVPNRNSFGNGLPSNGDDQLNRFFSMDNGNQSRLLNPGIGSSSITLQNIVSVEEIERVQQSVRN